MRQANSSLQSIICLSLCFHFLEAGDDQSYANTLNNLAGICYRRGKYRFSADMARKTADILRNYRDQSNYEMCLRNLILSLKALGLESEAEEVSRELLNPHVKRLKGEMEELAHALRDTLGPDAKIEVVTIGTEDESSNI